MAGETPITLVGNLTGDPELAFTPQGRARARFTLASTPRVFDRTTQDWRDGDTTFLPVEVEGPQAENVAESFARGDRVIVLGRLGQRSWQTGEGQKRTRLEVTASEVGASVRWASARVERAQRGAAQDQGGDDPWQSQVPGTAGFGGGQQGGGPPF